MKLTYKTIIQNYFHRFHAEVSMAAFTRTNPGIRDQSTPEFYRFWMIQEGGGRLQIGGRCLDLQPGQLLLVPPGTRQSFTAENDETVGLYWCHFRASIGDMDMFELLQLPISVVPSEPERVAGLFCRLIDACHSTALTRELHIRSAMFELLACYLEYGGFSESSLRENEPLDKIDHVLQYIEEHLSGPIAVEDMARLAYLHPNYFIGYFKNLIGYAPAQYVLYRRLERAKELLERKDASISDVARAVGMQNHYLSRMFRHYTGLTPSRYRQIYHQTAAHCEQAADKEDNEW
ncbi:helix-turn-helix transcriptional regulator [Paenibacillus sp. MWE-103]|uniref:Helix-turn-helix transcriptional regulator n=1 Tax=Paenibacillus artemisiicola TaxID=1172618 RepID=A0ABS3W5Z4_9BACL|nr:AraC family transcriptional regulator [Paenibacillus artemisiicola]MBO7743720.1 helix-turn-helix transcriptional regulator [Paenibacillus artemisiicola]